MNVFKCNGCGEYIHFDHITQGICAFCGTSNDSFNDCYTENSDTISQLINEGEMLLKERKYNKALRVFDKAIHLYPNNSRLLWDRLLAANKCSNDQQLIITGIEFNKSVDYCLALNVANTEEHDCYIKVCDVREALANELKLRLKSKKIQDLLDTNIIELQKEYEKRLKIIEDSMNSKIIEEQDVEKRMLDIVLNATPFLSAKKEIIKEYYSMVGQIKSEMESKKEITDEEFEDYKKYLQRISSLSDNEYDSIMKRQGIRFYDGLSAENKVIKQISKSIDEMINEAELLLEKYKSLLVSITVIENNYRLAIEDIDNGSFDRAFNLIGNELSTSIKQKYFSRL